MSAFQLNVSCTVSLVRVTLYKLKYRQSNIGCEAQWIKTLSELHYTHWSTHKVTLGCEGHGKTPKSMLHYTKWNTHKVTYSVWGTLHDTTKRVTLYELKYSQSNISCKGYSMTPLSVLHYTKLKYLQCTGWF